MLNFNTDELNVDNLEDRLFLLCEDIMSKLFIISELFLFLFFVEPFVELMMISEIIFSESFLVKIIRR